MPTTYPGAVRPQSPVMSHASFQSMSAVHSTANNPALSGFQCCGCHINSYKGRVMQNSQPPKNEYMLSEQQFKSFSDF